MTAEVYTLHFAGAVYRLRQLWRGVYKEAAETEAPIHALPRNGYQVRDVWSQAQEWGGVYGVKFFYCKSFYNALAASVWNDYLDSSVLLSNEYI